jgi:hypothetical protein
MGCRRQRNPKPKSKGNAYFKHQTCASKRGAYVLSRNRPMPNVFRRCGLPMAVRHEGDVIHVILSLREAG